MTTGRRKLRAKRRAAGVCTQCGAAAVPGMARCERHRAANNKASNASHVRSRELRKIEAHLRDLETLGLVEAVPS